MSHIIDDMSIHLHCKFTFATSLVGRQLSVEERELHRVGSVAERNSIRRLRELSRHAEHLRVLSSLRRNNGLETQTDKMLGQKCVDVLASLGSNPSPNELQIVLDAVEQFLSESETDPPAVTQLRNDLERFEATFMSPP